MAMAMDRSVHLIACTYKVHTLQTLGGRLVIFGRPRTKTHCVACAGLTKERWFIYLLSVIMKIVLKCLKI